MPTVDLDQIDIQGNATSDYDNGIVPVRIRSASKTNTSIRETPQAVSVVNRRQIEEQQANTVSEALRYTPGVLSEANGYDIRYDWLYVRGFSTYGTVWLDGLPLPGDTSGYATPSINPYALERIEVLKGPASVLYGRTLPGGLVNYVSKRPLPFTRNEVEIRASSFGGAQTSVDLTGPVTNAPEWKYRFVGQWRNLGTQIDRERDRQLMLAPSLTYTPDAATSFTAYAYYQHDNPLNFSPRFYPATGTLLPSRYGRIPRDTYLGNSGANAFNRDFHAIGYEFAHDFSTALTFRQNFRYAHSDQNLFLTLVNPAFAYRPDGHTLNRVSAGSKDELTSFAVDNQLEARFDTFDLHHTGLLGVDYTHAVSSRNFGNSALGVPAFDLLHPNYAKAAIPYPTYTTSVRQVQDQVGIYAQDQIRYAQWLGTFGMRYDNSEFDTRNRLTPIKPSVANNTEKLTGRAGLSYLFENGITPYVSYSTAFLPTLGTDVSGQAYKPQEAEQYEVGVKYEPDDHKGLVTLSLFNLDVANALTPTYLSGTQIGYVQTGKQRVRGVEVETRYELAPGLELLASYAYSDSKVLESNNAVERGQNILRLPEHQGSVWANYAIPTLPGVSLNAGVRASSSYHTDSTYLPRLTIPSRALVDLGAAYELGASVPALAGTTLRVNVSNLFDKIYVAQCLNATGGSCNYGAGRAIVGSLRYVW